MYKVDAQKDGFDGWALLDINLRNFHERPNFAGGSGVVRASLRRHRGSYNIVFLDGHTEAIKRDRLFAEEDDALRRWNVDNEPHADQLRPH